MSIGMIGGADGPTKIFVSNAFDIASIIGMIVAAVVLVVAVVFIWRRKRNK